MNKFFYKKIFKIAVLILSIGYVIWFLWDRREDIALSFQLDPILIVSISVLCLFYLLVYALRFKHVIEKSSGRRLIYYIWLKCFILGRFFNQFIPQFGNIYRSYQLKKLFGVSHTLYISSFFSYAWMDTILNFSIMLVVLLIFKPELVIFEISAILIVGSLLFIVIFTPIVIQRIFHDVWFRNKNLDWLSSKFKDVFEVSLSNIINFKYVFWFIILGLLSFVIVISIFYFIFLGIGISAELTQLVFFYTLHKLSTFINITPSNLGVRELAYGVLCSAAGYGMAQGIMVSVILRMFNFIILVILGFSFGGASIVKHRKDHDMYCFKDKV